MKNVIVHVSHNEMQRIIEEFEPGDTVELTDGERRLVFQTGNTGAASLEPEGGRPELAAEFLLGRKERPASFAQEDIEALTEEVRRKKDERKNDPEV
jgi:hypothetical protein